MQFLCNKKVLMGYLLAPMRNAKIEETDYKNRCKWERSAKGANPAKITLGKFNGRTNTDWILFVE